LYLWQIRYIPIHQQTLLKLTLLAVLFCASVVSRYPVLRFAFAQADDAAAGAAAVDSKRTPAEEFLDRVRQELPKHRTIQAEIFQSVSIGDQQFKIEGHYTSALPTTGGDHDVNRLRLIYRVIPTQGIHAQILEICDGKELWTELQLPDSKQTNSDSKRVTRRNVQEILSAATTANKQNIPDTTLNVELGLGGVSALIASLERTMTFDAMKEESADGHSRTIIQGHWKKEIAARFPKDKENNLPAFVPDLVRLHVNNDTLFPEKLYYLKKQPQKKTFKALLSLEFTKVEFDIPVDDAIFVYNVPSDITPETVTKLYVDRLLAPSAEAQPKK
jgi:hypothetical protein